MHLVQELLKKLELLNNYVGVLMLPVPKTGRFVSINEEQIMEIENVSAVDITVSRDTHLEMPPKWRKISRIRILSR